MKIAGILMFPIGMVTLVIGVIVCIVTLTDDYAPLACERAARDASKFSEAEARCGSTRTECYKQATVGLTTQEECEDRKWFMRKQLIMGIVPTVVGSLLAFIGLVLTVVGFVRARRKRVAIPS